MNWGLIGASTIASQYMIEAIRSLEGHEVSWLLSSDLDRGQAYASDHNITNATTSLDALLADPDVAAVYISTTNEKHFPQAMAAIAAGKHVLCEKPLAMSVEEAVEMVAAAKQAGVVFATNHHLRNAGSHLKIKELIDAGTIGDVLSIRVFHAVLLPEFLQGWRINNPQAGGGVIPDIVVHDADTVRFYLDEDPAEVVAIEHSGAMGSGVEDSVMSVWTMPSGIMVQTHESFTHKHARTGIEVYGTTGAIIATDVNTQQPVGEIELRTESGSKSVEFSDHNLYAYSLGKFANAMAGEGVPSATGEDGVKSLAVATAVKQAATSGQRTAVDYKGA